MRTLEVRQIYCDTHLDTRHFRSGSVDLGSKIVWRWRFLGVDLGPVPAPLRHILPWFPPIWSECEAVESADFQLADDDSLHSFFRLTSDGWVAQIPDGWSATLDGKKVHGATPIDGSLVIHRGDLRFEVDRVAVADERPRVVAAPEPPMLASFAFVATTGLMFGLGVHFAPQPATLSVSQVTERIAQVAIAIPPPAPERAAPSDTLDPGGTASSSSSPSSEPAASSTQSDLDTAQSAGLLAALTSIGGMESGPDGLADAVDRMVSPYGRGPAIGSRRGDLGDSLRGGGDVSGIGDLSGTGDRYGYGSRPDGSGLLKKAAGGPITIAQEPMVLGSITPEDVDRVIKQHLSQIRYCYQRQLPRQPDLAGKLVVKFVIAKDGGVSSASIKSSTVANTAVESCVVDRIQRMHFVEPQGGGIAIVSYPFLFSPG